MNGLRSIHDLLLVDPDQAREQYGRWCKVMIQKSDTNHPCFDALRRFVGEEYQLEKKVDALPLADLLILDAMTRNGPGRSA